ncbi:hypothetical protein KAR91_21435 [Candidatus Pacearchaeota archaeon]|nr:hypothetical protein [Candidatus Pacearchaeota archaeon]
MINDFLCMLTGAAIVIIIIRIGHGFWLWEFKYEEDSRALRNWVYSHRLRKLQEKARNDDSTKNQD